MEVLQTVKGYLRTVRPKSEAQQLFEYKSRARLWIIE